MLFRSTLNVLRLVDEFNKKGLDCYATMDAGPNVKILTRQSNVELIIDELSMWFDKQKMIICLPGEGATILNES